MVILEEEIPWWLEIFICKFCARLSLMVYCTIHTVITWCKKNMQCSALNMPEFSNTSSLHGRISETQCQEFLSFFFYILRSYSVFLFFFGGGFNCFFFFCIEHYKDFFLMLQAVLALNACLMIINIREEFLKPWNCVHIFVSNSNKWFHITAYEKTFKAQQLTWQYKCTMNMIP